MELCPNGELIETLFYPGEPFTEPITRYVFKQILDGLKSVHQEGLVHRDIKPENILFDQEWNIKLADFGFATLSSGREGSGMCQTNLGTPGYKPRIQAFDATCSEKILIQEVTYYRGSFVTVLHLVASSSSTLFVLANKYWGSE